MNIFNWFFSIFKNEKKEQPKRIFVSFAIEDQEYRNLLKEQARKGNSPFNFIDMSAKKAWKQDEWQKKCRTKIKRSHGVIALLSKNTYHAGGERWEIKCAKEEGIPVIGMHISKNKAKRGAIPTELKTEKIIDWTWDNIHQFINSL